ncbi:hypothetical protein FB45DRAFT_863424 [Roridomyces roridus]|uniref:Uncharacterized protein n=1 Tax=Roridomyces roridus TaxID=1738132 RepID=A0AAD7C3Q1_9AGAR|nr:hypothetical protein FB45DRAFT_863424 [Roridomyces roridus]
MSLHAPPPFSEDCMDLKCCRRCAYRQTTKNHASASSPVRIPRCKLLFLTINDARRAFTGFQALCKRKMPPSPVHAINCKSSESALFSRLLLEFWIIRQIDEEKTHVYEAGEVEESSAGKFRTRVREPADVACLHAGMSNAGWWSSDLEKMGIELAGLAVKRHRHPSSLGFWTFFALLQWLYRGVLAFAVISKTTCHSTALATELEAFWGEIIWNLTLKKNSRGARGPGEHKNCLIEVLVFIPIYGRTCCNPANVTQMSRQSMKKLTSLHICWVRKSAQQMYSK